MTGVTWPRVTEEQLNTGILQLMTGVACGVELQVIEAITVPDWGLCDDTSDALTLVIGVTWPGVTEEQRNTGVLVLMTGVTCGGDLQGVVTIPGVGIGSGSTLPVSMLLPLPMLRCGGVKREVGVGRVIFTELCFEGSNLSSHCLVEGGLVGD